MATIIGTAGNDSALDGGPGDDLILAFGGSDTIDGGEGNDVIVVGPGGNDVIEGGAGQDTLVLQGSFADYAVTFQDGALVLTKDGVEAAVSGVETLVFDDQVVRVAGAGSENGIQAAIDAAAEGETILVAEGVYAENIVVDKAGITITGAGDPANVVIKGSMRSDNGIPDGVTVGDWLEAQSGYDAASGAGLTIRADGVTVASLTIAEFYVGVALDSNEGLTIENVVFDQNVLGLYKEDGAAVVTGFQLLGGSIANGYQGLVVNAAEGGGFDQVTVDGTSFAHLTWKGIYAEQLSNAVITGISMEDVGQFGRAQFSGGAVGSDGSGIELNLKFDHFENVTISDFTLVDVGLSSGGGSPHANGAAIAVKARDDAPSYSGDPATLDGVTIENGTIDGTSTGIRTGEPGKTNATPSNVTIDNVTITDALHSGTHGDLDNGTASTVTVVLNDAGQTFVVRDGATGSFDFQGGAGNDSVIGGDGDDSFMGGRGLDIFDGGDGYDRAIYAGKADEFLIELNYGGGVLQVHDTVYAGMNEGSDALKNVETLQFADIDIHIVDGSGLFGGFATIQAAIDAADAGDAIIVLGGTYSESLSVTKGLTIVGAPGTTIEAADGPAVTISGDHGGASTSFSGISFTGGSGSITSGSGVYVTATGIGTLTFENSNFSGNDGAGLFTYDAGIESLKVLNSHFAGNGTTGLNSGGHIKLFGFTGDALLQNLVLEGAADGSPQAERPDYGIELHGVENAALNGDPSLLPPIGSVVIDGVTITGEFHKRPLAINNYADLQGLGITNLDLSNAESWWGQGDTPSFLVGFDGISSDIDLSLYNILFNGLWPAASLLGEHGSQEPVAQVLTGTTGQDLLDGKGGNDHLKGLGGDDLLLGGAGNDTLNGGRGNDTMVGGEGNDLYSVDSAGDLVVEEAGGGHDRVRATIDSYTLTAEVEELVYGGSGNFQGTGNALANLLVGGAGNDTLNGGGGADTMVGNGGADRFVVNTVEDVILQAAGTGSTVFSNAIGLDLNNANWAGIVNAQLGSTGNLSLTGNAEGNRLTGNAGDNVIAGGLGSDTLIGGGGSDVFKFDSVEEAGLGAARDRIMDFVSAADAPGLGQAADLIDLSGIDAQSGVDGNNSFAWIGNGAFSRTEGELRYVVNGGNTMVQGDVNGDGLADFQLLLVGNITLGAVDFIL